MCMYLNQGCSAKEKKGKKVYLKWGGGGERSMHFLIFCNRKNVLSGNFSLVVFVFLAR